MYLTRRGLVSPKELKPICWRRAEDAYSFPFEQLESSFIYLALQEKATHLYYRALARTIR